MSRSIWTAASDLDWYDEGEPWQECGGCGRRDAERRMTCENAGTLAVWWCVECAADDDAEEGP